jgi:beta-glucosidase
VLIALACAPLSARAQRDDQAIAVARKVLSQMTIEEKVTLCHGASTMSIGAVPRVGVPDEFSMDDGPNNVRPDVARDDFTPVGRNDDFSTSLPPLSGLAATWDVAMATKFGEVMGEEARARGKDMILGPGVNMMRSPLCGRNFEYMGEDPELAGTMATAYIRALQSRDVAACVKHYTANNQELNRGSVDEEIDERTLREIYLPAFEAAVTRGGALGVMDAYNKVRGEWCSENSYLNNTVLKTQWGFKGFVVTDWGGMHDTLAAALGGADVEMSAGNRIHFFARPLLEAVQTGKVPEAVVNDKALRVLYVMSRVHKIGGGTRVEGSLNTPEHQQIARQIAENAIVLLKNEAGLLPLNAAVTKHVLVLGRTAVNLNCRGGGSAAGRPAYEITPLAGLKKRLGAQVEVDYAPFPANGRGAGFTFIPDSALATFDTSAPETSLATAAWQAEYFNNPDLQDSPAASGFERGLDFNWHQGSPRQGVNAAGFSARWTANVIAPETGKYVFSATGDAGSRVFVDHQLIVDNWKPNLARNPVTGEATLESGKRYVFKVEYRQNTGDGVFSLKWQLPSDRPMTQEEIRTKAQQADVVFLFTGDSHGRGQAREGEGADRPNMKLPAGDDEAIAGLVGLNPKTVVVNLSGTPVEMPWIDQAPTLVQYWFSGQEGGNALAAVLFGDVNPSGKLPFTFPVKLEDTPAAAMNNYNAQRVNYAEGIFIGYRWFDAKGIKPLFPFGYGLSYTTFAYKNARVSQPTLAPGGQVQVSVDVTNTGLRPGAEIVELYVHDPKRAVDKAPRELKGFAKVMLAARETRTVTMTLEPRDFAYFDVAGKQWKADAGRYELGLGASSRDLRQEISLELTETYSRPL